MSKKIAVGKLHQNKSNVLGLSYKERRTIQSHNLSWGERRSCIAVSGFFIIVSIQIILYIYRLSDCQSSFL